VIVVDTHIWVWWVQGDPRLTAHHRHYIEQHEEDEIGVCVISCWEVALLAVKDRLVLPLPVDEWIEGALLYPGVRLLDLTPYIAIESTRLPGGFHRDPADQFIVATAREFDCELITVDQRILDYPHVKTIAPR